MAIPHRRAERHETGNRTDPAELSPAERLNVDELRAHQLERLRWTLRHAYENVPLYRRKFDEAGVHPDDCTDLADLASSPSPPRTTCERLSVRHVRRAAGQVRAHPCLQRHHGQAHRRRLHRGRHRHLGRRDRPLHPRGGRPARAHGAHRLRLRPVHRRPGRALRRREAGLHGHPVSGGKTERQVQLITDFRAGHHHGHAQLHAGDHRRVRAAGHRPARRSLRVGIFGAEPWTERHARARSSSASTSTPSTSTACPR